MSVRHLILLLKTSLRGPVTPPLGRWSHGNHTQTTLKIQYANEDNCGTCGGEYDYNTTHLETIDKPNQEIEKNELKTRINNDKDEIYLYMIGLESVHTTAGK
jgi:hypothetical protein